MKKICETCEYRGEPTGRGDDLDGRLRSCNYPEHFEGYYDDPKGVPDNGILIESYEGGTMLTGPKFGCVNWMAK